MVAVEDGEVVEGGDYSGVLHQLLSAGWPCLSKKKGEKWRKRGKERKAFNAAH